MLIVLMPYSIWHCLENFRYIKLYPWFGQWLLSLFGLLTPVFASLAMFSLEMKRGIMNATIRRVLTVLLIVCHLTLGNAVFISSFAIPMFKGGFYSETVDPSNYMILGGMEKDELGEDLTLMFPEDIPEYALGERGSPCPNTTRYYNYAEQNWDSKFEVYAQWKLTQADWETEKRRIQETFSQEITSQGRLGDWEYLSVRMDPLPCLSNPRYYDIGHVGYTFLFFAWDEETGLARYVASHASDDMEPGFCSLDWE